MTLLYYDPIFLEHQTGNHPENARRLQHVIGQLQRTGLDGSCVRPSWKPASAERVERVHRPQYTSQVQEFCHQHTGRIEADTVVGPRSYEVALQAAGAVCDAVERVVGGEDRNALCLVRPPGHHALADSAMGFCLFNNIAVGARLAVDELGLDRVLIVDWDVHHGNGTQDAFWEDGQVGFFSAHRWPFYPGTGAGDETGSGRGLGTTVNLPVSFGTSRRAYHDSFESSLVRLADQTKPQLVMISAGFDAHHEDPIGSLGLETEDFQTLTRLLLQIADQHAGGRLVSVLEGGYNPTALSDCVEVHLSELVNST